MSSFTLATILGAFAGVSHMLVIRWLADKMIDTSDAPYRMVLGIASLRLAPAALVVSVILLWGAGSGLGILSGYWLGRTGVLGAMIAETWS